jgi:hypothetical protein
MRVQIEAYEREKNQKLALQMVSGCGVKSYKQVWSLETTSSGRRFTFMEEIEFPFGIIGKFIDPIAQRMFEAIVSKIQLKLKALAEA